MLYSDDAAIARRARVIKTRFTLPVATDALRTALITRLAFRFSARAACVVLTEISKSLQETQEPVAIAFVHLLVKCFLVDGFRQHLGDVALHVVGDLATDFRLATKRFFRLEQVCHRLHHVDLETDTENLAVMKNSAMMIGKTSWSKIEVEAFVKLAYLAEGLAAFSLLFEDGAAPRGVIATAGHVRLLQ